MVRKNLFEKAFKENTIFLDERFLYPEFLPEKLIHREKEIESLVYCFEPILKARKPLNVFLAGPTGVGKTVSVKYVLSQLEESFDRAKSIYLNCFEFNSRSSVLSSIANFVGAGIPRRGLATDEIFSHMLEGMKKCGFTPIVILDEVDQLLISESNAKLLYDLLRVIEYEKQRIGIVMISNDAALVSKLDSRIRSSMAEQTILFEKYSPQELKSILSSRAELAFIKNAISPDVIGIAAAHAAKLGGDARVAIESLLKAGRIAERENAKEVSIDHLKKAFEFVDSASLLKGLPHLSEIEIDLLKIIAENQPIVSGKVYEIYSTLVEAPLKQRRLREILLDLAKKNFISIKSMMRGNKGNTKEFSLMLPEKMLLAEISKIKF